MIFAKLDVCMWSHEKFVAAGPAACGYWSAALAYLRGHDSEDGIIPPHVLGMILGVGDKEARRLCQKLVETSLFASHGGRFELLNYAAKNETKTQIEARRAATRVRVDRLRGRSSARKPPVIGACNAVTNADHVTNVTHDVTLVSVTPVTTEGSAFVPGSDSDSDSGSDLGQEGVQGEEPRPAADPAPPAPTRHRAGVFGMEGDAFARGVQAATGRPCRPPTPFECGDFLEPSAAHSGGLTGQELLDWFTLKAEKFVRSVDPKFGFSTRRFADWLDRGEPVADELRQEQDERARSRRVAEEQKAIDRKWESDEAEYAPPPKDLLAKAGFR